SKSPTYHSLFRYHSPLAITTHRLSCTIYLTYGLGRRKMTMSTRVRVRGPKPDRKRVPFCGAFLMFVKSRAVKVLAGMGVGAALVLLFENSASSQGFGFRPGPVQRPQSGPLNNGSLQPGFVFGFQPTPNPMFSGGSNSGS